MRPFDRTVVRAGYGIFIGRLRFFGHRAERRAAATASRRPFRTPTRRQPQYTFPNPFGASGGIGTIAATGFKVDLKNPYSQQWNLTLEREIADVGLRLSYIGTKATSLAYPRQLNVPPAERHSVQQQPPAIPAIRQPAVLRQRRQFDLPRLAGGCRAAVRRGACISRRLGPGAT